jgi:hypothetical protein
MGIYLKHTLDGKRGASAGLDCVFTDADIGDSFPNDRGRDSKGDLINPRKKVRLRWFTW